MESIPAPQLRSLLFYLFSSPFTHLYQTTLASKEKFFHVYGKGEAGGYPYCGPQIHAIFFNRFKTDIPHKSFMGSTIQMLFYLAA